MDREIILGNKTFFLNIDRHLNIRDIYYPHVGQFNHLSGEKNRIGIWVDNKFSWIDDNWKLSFKYKRNSLTAVIDATNPGLGISFKYEAVVHKYMPLFIACIRVKNLEISERNVKFYFYHDFNLNETPIGNTAFYYPELNGLIHYKDKTYFFISIEKEEGDFEYTVSKKEESSLKEIEEGKLYGRPIVRGDIDSAVGVSFRLKTDFEFFYYILAGNSLDDIEDKKKKINQDGLWHLVEETDIYWNAWIKERKSLCIKIPKDVKELYDRSLYVIRAHIDRDGAIIASADSSIFHRFNKDHYSYSWSRDASFITPALDFAGYGDITKKYFEFCARTITKKGYFLQKYLPNGSFGSSWHPWSDLEGNPQLPIQEDETALVIWALYQHYLATKDIEFIDNMYNRLVRPAAKFMVSYRDEETGLPLKSYDLWEERRGFLTYTTATVYGGLKSASKLAKLTGNLEEAETYERTAEEVREALIRVLYDKELGRFLRMIDTDKGKLYKDTTVDASLSAVFFMEVLPPHDERVISTMRAIEEKLYIKEGIGGVARYENDHYHRVSDRYPNPWIVTTMWLADWYIQMDNLNRALELVNWVVKRQNQAGLLAEQFDPYTGKPLSVIPLTWSHAAFCRTVQKLDEKLKEQI